MTRNQETSSSRSRFLSRRRLGAFALAVVVVLVLGAGALLRRPADEKGAEREALLPAAARVAGAAGAGGGEELEEAGARCWQNLAVLGDDAISLSGFRDLAAPLLAAGDASLSIFLAERLAELIGDDEERALEVLKWARGASDEELDLILDALRGAPAVQSPAVAEALLAMGLDQELDLGRRAQALAALDSQHSLPESALERLAEVALDADTAEAGWMATRTIGAVMQEVDRKTGDVEPYVERLLAIGSVAPEPAVRAMALEMPMVADILHDGTSTERLADLLRGDPAPDVRAMAAHNLYRARDTSRALEVYAEAFAAEPELCVRWAFFRFAAAAAGAEALPVMAGMAATDPRFAGVYRQFEEIYASGVVDFERVWLALPDQDPFDCLHDDGDHA